MLCGNGRRESDVALNHDLDLPEKPIEQRNIFDLFVGEMETARSSQRNSSLPISITSLYSPLMVEKYEDRKLEGGSHTERKGDLLLLQSGSRLTSAHAPTVVKRTVDFELELPLLAKRPRSIMDGVCLRETPPTIQGSSVNAFNSSAQTVCLPDLGAEIKTLQADIWRDAGKQSQDSATAGESTVTNEAAGCPDKTLLTWDSNTKTESRSLSDMRIKSPYSTEAGTPAFESLYKKHLDYAFKFRPTPVTVSYESLVDCILLLLSGTPSSIFAYNEECMKFDMDIASFRIKGCSTTSIMNLLQDTMKTGTHMRRLVHIAETCITDPEGMGLIRIAFSRSLSSYLTFLQGTIVALREHADHDLKRASALLGLYIPPGGALLSMIYDEILQEPMTSDPLWTSLLLSLLSQASTPYMEILGRWLGISPSTREGHERSKGSYIANSDGLPTRFELVERDIDKGGDSPTEAIFDCHLKHSLQDLDPFGEFFVQSKHGWSWDGSEPVILADPLEYDDEFQISECVQPPRFINARLAHKVMEAGKALQLLGEYDPKHPLIMQNRERKMTIRGLKWMFVQEDIALYTELCSELAKQVLEALAAKLVGMGWLTRPNTESGWTQKLKQPEDENPLALECEDAMDVDGRVSEHHSHKPLNRSLELNPQDFSLLPPTLGKARDSTKICPDGLELLLEPFAQPNNASSTSSFPPPPPTNTHGRMPKDMASARIRLENVASLTILAEQSLYYAIEKRTSLINVCMMSLYYHDLDLMAHLYVMDRFLLMRNARFTEGLSLALFEGDTGLVSRAAQASIFKGDVRVFTGQTGSGMGFIQSNDDRHSSAISVSPSNPTRTISLPSWPPRSGELGMTLRAVLLDCFQSLAKEGVNFESMGEDTCTSDGINSGIEVGETSQSSPVLTRKVLNRKGLSVTDLEQSLAFATKEYSDDSEIIQDVHALEALDFLYLDYKPPRPLRLLFFTPEAMDKYTRLFTFQLQLTRVGAALRQVYRQLRVRQKALTSLHTSTMAGHSPDLRQQGLHQQEMAMLHRFRFEAHHIFDGFHGFITDVAIGTTWGLFVRRLNTIRTRIEDRIMSGKVEPVHEWMVGLDDHVVEDQSRDSEADTLENLKALHEYHDHILDQMLERSFLKRKHVAITKVVYGILNWILKLLLLVGQLPDVPHVFQHSRLGLDLNGADSQGQLETRIARLKSMYVKFRSLCCKLIRVLKAMGTQESNDGLVRQLL
ncbi:hypothetical protein BGZ65_009594, partial [Modicella reniformis]